MAFYAFRINDLGDKFDFNSLENLFFKAREINIQQTKEVNEFLLTRDNDVNDFSNVHPATVDGLIPDEKTIPSSNIDTISPYDLEKLVEQAYLNLGYEAIATKKSGDQGADVVVKNPDTELITVIQVKQYSAKVGNKAVQEIIAGKAFYNANEAIVMTNNYFTESAVTLAENTGVILFDREKFINFLDKAYKK
ncbi:restriction endonuclease [Lactobacillus reuteri]|nr:restriction endonuclease [Lactobacillus sp.]MQB73686.1 restriction endonuclease [Limosilactobacillus reuteri]